MTPEQQSAQERIDALLEEIADLCKAHSLATIACILTGISARNAIKVGADFASGLLTTLADEETSENQKAFALGVVGYLLDNAKQGTPEDFEELEEDPDLPLDTFNQTPIGHA